MWTEDHEKSTTDEQIQGARRTGPLAKKALPTKGCRDDALACPCLFGPVWPAFGAIFRDDCPQNPRFKLFTVVIVPEPTFKRIAIGIRISPSAFLFLLLPRRTHLETHSGWPSDFRRPLFCFCFSLAEPTFKRIAGGRRIFAVRFFVFASNSGLGRLSAVIAPKLTHSGWPSDFRRLLFCFCFSLVFGAVHCGDCPKTHDLTHSGWPSDFRRLLFCFCFSLGFGAVHRRQNPRLSSQLGLDRSRGRREESAPGIEPPRVAQPE